MKKLAIATTAILLNVSWVSQALAEKLDLSNHNSLIQKLESVMNLDSKDSMVQHSSLAHRLADLYAERARLLSMEKEGQGDKIYHVQILSDRRRAIAISKQIVESLDKAEKGPVLLQMAHLYGLNGENEESLKICQQIEKKPSAYDRKTLALAHIQLGDVAFSKGSLEEAQSQFNAALKLKENPRRGYTLFRLAWVHFNRGQTILAEKELIDLLKNPNLFKTSSGSMEASFQEDVSRDLATFMAHNDITDQSIENLSKLSPENSRKKNLIYLAEELDRTAKKKSALKVWAIVGAQAISFEDHLERQIQITRIEYDLGHKDQIIVEIKNSIVLLKDSKCAKSAECTVAGQNLRRIITDWAKAEEREPSPQLITAYQVYTQSFEDYEMNYWAAQAAIKKKNYPAAFEFYSQAAVLIHKKSQDTDQLKRMHEGSLLGSIEAAELSQNADLRLKAYRQYLDLNPNGAKASEVRYQIAHWYYEKNDYTKASEELRKLALDEKMPLDLRIKSADLCLDSDVILKNESAIEAHSLELSQKIKSKTSEYLAIYRKSVLNQTAKIINEAQSDKFASELQKIQGLNSKGWPQDQRKLLVKNMMVLSFRLKDLDSLSLSSQEFLSLKGLNPEERGMALQHLAWIAELRMNFREAIRYMSRMQPSAKEKPEYYFKMAMLRELSQQNPTADYLKYLSLSRDNQKRQYAAHQIVIYSRRPLSEFNKYERLLRGSRSLYRSAAIFAYEKSGDKSLAKRLLAQGSFRNSPEGSLISHQFAFRDFQDMKKKLAQMKIRPGSDRALKKALDQRIRALKQMETLANQTIRQKDTSRQLVFLSELANQNARLANEILALPIPRQLKAPADRAAYQAQVQALVQPYQKQSQQIQLKTQEIWKQAMAQNTFQDLYAWSAQKQKPGCQLAAQEIATLRASARQSGLAADPFGNLSAEHQKVASEAESLHLRIQKNPFSSEDLEKMKSLQLTLGSGPMIAYLDNRLNELKAHGGRN